MKNIKLIFAIGILLTSCHNFAQVGVIKPINTSGLDVLNGTYIKDTNNSFAPFIGNWRVSWNGKTITFYISKVIKNLDSFPNGDFYFEDRVIARYVITDNITGADLDQTLFINNFKDQKIINIGYAKNGKFEFLYTDKDLCGYGGIIYLRQDANNPNIMNYGFMFEREFQLPTGCVYLTIQSIPIPIPTTSLVLTRI
jgi:hypothetical protein